MGGTAGSADPPGGIRGKRKGSDFVSNFPLVAAGQENPRGRGSFLAAFIQRPKAGGKKKGPRRQGFFFFVGRVGGVPFSVSKPWRISAGSVPAQPRAYDGRDRHEFQKGAGGTSAQGDGYLQAWGADKKTDGTPAKGS